MSGATESLPDLRDASDASANAQSGIQGFLGVVTALARGDSSSPLQGVNGALSGLGTALNIDVSGLAQALPSALTTIENALPVDTLRFVADLEDAYQQVSTLLADNELVRQIRPGSNLEQTALALIEDVLGLFQARLGQLGSSLFDAQTLERVRSALAMIEQLATGTPSSVDELTEFLAQNLAGVAPDLLAGANTRLTSALSTLEPFSAAALATHGGDARVALAQAYKAVAQAVRDFDPEQLTAYAALEAQLQTLGFGLDTALDGLDALYAALAQTVGALPWDALFEDYAAVLSAIAFDQAPTLDDVIDLLAGTIESLLSRLTMSLSPEELAAQVRRVSGSIHDLFASSALGQVRQILIDFIGRIQSALASIPSEQVDEAVRGMLGRVHEELERLQIDRVRTTIAAGFEGAQRYIDDHLGAGLLTPVNEALASATQQFQRIPIAEIGRALTGAIQEAGGVLQDLEGELSSALAEFETLLSRLDAIDFRPAADVVIDEIDALKTKLSAIRPDALSDVEKVAIQAALSLLRALDLEGLIERELKHGFAVLDDEIAGGVQVALDAWLQLRARMGGLDGSSLIGPVTGLLEQLDGLVQGMNGALLVAPLESLVEQLIALLATLSPESLLDPLQEPYARMRATIERANPDVWVAPLRALHAEIDRLITLIDITPLLTTLEQRESELFAQAQQSVVTALDAVSVPAPLDPFYQLMKGLVLGLTGAVFGAPDTALEQLRTALSSSVRPSSLFQPVDAAFDRLLAAVDALPAPQLLAALESLRQGLGAALPALEPAGLMASMHSAMARLAELSPASLAGAVTLPSVRTQLAVRLTGSTTHPDEQAALLARFDLVLVALDPAPAESRLARVTASHAALVDALRRRIERLDHAAAQAAFQRVDVGLRRLLPAFLMQSTPLDGDSLRAGLASLRPSTKARRIDLALEHFLAQLAPLQSALDEVTSGFFGEIRQAALLLHPGGLKDSVAAVYATLRDKLHVLDPDELASALRSDIWEPLLDPLQALDPAALKLQLHALFEALVAKLSAAVTGLLVELKSALDAFLVQIRQALSGVLAALSTQVEQIAAGVRALIEQLDHLVVDALFERLLRLLDNLKESFDRELDRVRNEFDAMLNAIPLGGGSASAGAAA